MVDLRLIGVDNDLNEPFETGAEGKRIDNERITSSTFYDEFSFLASLQEWDGVKNIYNRGFSFFEIMIDRYVPKRKSRESDERGRFFSNLSSVNKITFF